MYDVKLQLLGLNGDAGLRTQIRDHLSNIGMTARGVGDARQLDQALADPSAAIVVCAADLPESDGYAVAARLRISTGAGIVMLMPDDRRESRSEEHTSEIQSLMRI